MTTKKVKYTWEDGLSYFTDQGTSLNFNPNFGAPSDVDDGMINEILACHNLQLRTETAPCGERGVTTPRKITYQRSNGNSFSLILPTRGNVIDAATCVRDLFASTAYPIICIEYTGEHSKNLIEELASGSKGAPSAAPVIAPPTEKGKHALVYSTVMREYASDTPLGKVILMPFKSQTNTEDSPYIELVDFFETCTGPFTTVSCASASSAEYRRYIPTFLTIENDLETGQTATAPVKTAETSQIKACGELLASMTSVICLEYYGESNKKLHKLLPQTNG